MMMMMMMVMMMMMMMLAYLSNRLDDDGNLRFRKGRLEYYGKMSVVFQNDEMILIQYNTIIRNLQSITSMADPMQNSITIYCQQLILKT